MIKFNYPDDTAFLDEYYAIFNFSKNEEDKWNQFINFHPKKNSYLPKTLKELIICQPSTIIEVFKNFINKKYTKKELKTISFINYEKYYEEIIQFFLGHKEQLDISTCCYCDLAYINMYHNELKEDLLEILNSPYDEEIFSLFKRAGEECSQQVMEKIKKKSTFYNYR